MRLSLEIGNFIFACQLFHKNQAGLWLGKLVKIDGTRLDYRGIAITRHHICLAWSEELDCY